MRWPQVFHLEVERSARATREGGYAAYWRAWEELRRGMSANLRRKPCRRVLRYAELQASEHWREYDRSWILRMGDKGFFSYFFDDEQGNANVYCGVVPHWIEIALGLRYDKVADALGRVGYVLKHPRPDLAAIAAAEVEAPLVEVAGFVARLAPMRAGEGGWELEVDIGAPPASALEEDADERARLDRVFSGKRCMCDFCAKLRA
jgi:hypothetical protein